MNCNEVLELLDKYIENDLSEKQMADIKDHIEKCPECNSVFQEEKEINDLLNEALNDESIEFNSRIEEVMSSIDHTKYAGEEKVVDLNSVKEKKHRKVNKKFVGIAAVFAIMLGMTPTLINRVNNSTEKANLRSKNEFVAYDAAEKESYSNSDDGMAEIESIENEGAHKVNSVEDTRAIVGLASEDYTGDAPKNPAGYSRSSDNGKNIESDNNYEHEDETSYGEPIKMNMQKGSKIDSNYLKEAYGIEIKNETDKTFIEYGKERFDSGYEKASINSYIEDSGKLYFLIEGIESNSGKYKREILEYNPEKNAIKKLKPEIEDKGNIKGMTVESGEILVETQTDDNSIREYKIETK